jgi:predicted N-acetyltransferase YhbS
MQTLEVDQSIAIRPIRPDDVERCGQIAFEAHRDVAARHNFPSEQPSIEFSIGLIKTKIADSNAHGMIAEHAGDIVGSAFLNTFPPAPVAAIGPLTVSPNAPAGVGRRLLTVLLDDTAAREFASVRLVQSPSHLQSLALYAKLGFVVREPLVLMQGECPAVAADAARAVRPAVEDDIAACDRLSERVIGFARQFELRNAIRQNLATVIERSGRVTGHCSGIGFRGHAIAETTADLQALLAATPQMPGPGFFVPTRNGELLRWLLQGGLRMLWPATLMTRGGYQEPAGAFLPSIAF